MKGSRPLREDEVRAACDKFGGRWRRRNRCLFLLGLMLGFRISELLSIRVRDVVQHQKVVQNVTVARSNMKGKREGRTVFLNIAAQRAVLNWVKELKARGYVRPDTYLFLSQQGINRPISYSQAWRVLDKVFSGLGLQGRLGTHCMRKTFVQRTYRALQKMQQENPSVDPLPMLRMATGHKSYDSLLKYLSFREDIILEALERIGEQYETRVF